MKRCKIIVWIIGVAAVGITIFLHPEYSETAAKAVMILLGDKTCDY